MTYCPTCGCDPCINPDFCQACSRADETVMTTFRGAREMLKERMVQHERQPRFQLRRFDQLRIGTERTYLVKGLIPRTGLVVAWGPPKCGKSFWTFDLTLHIALGRQYRRRRVQQGPTVYCAFEGGSGYNARAEAFRQRYLSEDHGPIEFYLLDAQINLVADHAAIIGAIRSQVAGSQAPACVVLDTLNRSLAGSESNDKDMALYIRAADAIREAFACVVIIVHHCGIDDTRPRGHTSLTGAVDAQLAVRRDATENVIVEVEWMKDGPEGDVIASRLERVEIGIDADGDPLSSCVIVPVEGDLPRTAAPRRKLSDRQKLALEALTEVTLRAGTHADPDWQLPVGIKTVKANEWREEMERRSVIDPDGANPRAAFRQVRDRLAARKLIGVRDGHVWPA
jgi:AAA domain-containing protein